MSAPLVVFPTIALPNIAVVNNITTQVAINLALFSPGVVQTIVQASQNQVGINQGAGALALRGR